MTQYKDGVRQEKYKLNIVSDCLYTRQALCELLTTWSHSAFPLTEDFLLSEGLFQRPLIISLDTVFNSALLFKLLHTLAQVGSPRILMLSACTTPGLVRLACTLGVEQVISKQMSYSHLQETLQSWIISEPPRFTPRVSSMLTFREHQCLVNFLQGKNAHQQACQSGLDRKTIYSHRSNALKKLGVRNFQALMVQLPYLTDKHLRLA
ncbi:MULTISPECIES: LuxR C-terminal-related transcriptional regulator [Hafnia]|uniref:LuxR C-terminal-related transcriptional regulator n=1 Tax=Hafnia TaxID=568 RepID=UPI001033665B|nr:LuxR C-terminal-related transcriptional regulator [Hafnia paralvei]TBL97812.1 hypothetical protein EYY93_17940 [Hafnia paralvei]UBM40175.1 LuxR C-terminal-related transcriptional regulator [Hafnia paralvei]